MRRKPIRKRAAGGRGRMNTPNRMGRKVAKPLLVPAPQSMKPINGNEDQIMYPYCLASPEDPCCKNYGTPRFEPGAQICYNGQYVYEQGGMTSNRTRVRAGERPVDPGTPPKPQPGRPPGPVDSAGLVGLDSNQVFAPFCSGNPDHPCCNGWGTPRFNPARPCWDDRAITLQRGGRTKPVVRRNRRKAVGGSMGTPSSCPPGTHMMPDGSCMQGEYHGAPNGGGYRRGGRLKGRKFANGGRMHTGGNTGCRMHTSKYDCVSPCQWDFNDGVCH